jgi:NTP pyrophosphatase (non-canonical NTP hydrolase)
MTPPNTPSLAALQQAVREFRDARNWRQFHSPKNLGMSIAIEAAELMEHFQWLTPDEATTLAQTDPAARQAIAEELADVLIYCLSLADVLEYNVAEIITAKLAKNTEKYPVKREA